MRTEWPALLHNLCMLHSLVRLRTRYGLTGWNKPMDLRNLGTAELWVRIFTLYTVGIFTFWVFITKVDISDVFITASIRLSCTRISRQFRLGSSDWRLYKKYSVEWIAIHVSRGMPQHNNIKHCKLDHFYRFILNMCCMLFQNKLAKFYLTSETISNAVLCSVYWTQMNKKMQTIWQVIKCIIPESISRVK